MIGETIGNFKITAELGRGGMGEVYLVEHTGIGTRAAIKILQQAASSDDMIARFFNEAKAVSKIQHAGIVKIFDVGTHNGRAYLVMEFLDGESLTARIKRGALSVAQIADLGKQIASVLEATHAAGITHRDLKPDNIYIVPDQELGERIKVLDFGIAKLTGTLAASGPKTVGAMGTPDYMAPEQWGDASKVDHRADIYSLGCVVYEMATGRTPFAVTTIADACNKHMNVVPLGLRTSLPGIPVPLEALVARMLAKKPEMRPQSMADVGKAFEVVARATPSTPSPPGAAMGPTQPSVAMGTPMHPTPMHPTPRPTPMGPMVPVQPMHPTPMHPTPGQPVAAGPVYPRPGSQPNFVPGPGGAPLQAYGQPPRKGANVGLIVGLCVGAVVLLLVILGVIGAMQKRKSHATCAEAAAHAAAHAPTVEGVDLKAVIEGACNAGNWPESARDCLATSDNPDGCETPDNWK